MSSKSEANDSAEDHSVNSIRHGVRMVKGNPTKVISMNLWNALLDVLLLLLTAMVLGGIFERLRQNALLGYLAAGVALGPHAFNLIPHHEVIASIAELGVALLLFSIGLEFSWRKLRSLGAIAFGGGTLQILSTIVLSAWAATKFGLDLRQAFAVGATIALSSTAVVIRLLADRAEIDSAHGRNALGILLLQDMAVVPLVLAVTVLAGEGTVDQMGWGMARAVGATTLLATALLVVLKYLLPRLFHTKEAAVNRDLPILLATVTAVGCAWGSHALGLSPVLGAFVGGMILAETPFATQIRSNVAPLKTIFVTLFFSSIGMLANPAWAVANWTTVAALAGAVVFGKLTVVSVVARVFRSPAGHSVATGLCLAQIGEFSFVLAEVSRSGQLISSDLFELMIAVTVVTLFLTPYFVAMAPRFARLFGRVSARSFPQRKLRDEDRSGAELRDHIVIVGFGPAGKAATEELLKEELLLVIVELNPNLAESVRALGIPVIIGDATRLETLEHADVEFARAIAITVPDPAAAQQITRQLHSMAPRTPIIVRSRYHRYTADLVHAGASGIADEETEVGLRIASKLRVALEVES